ncbi:MAG TPA: MFS transporter, partial [Gaiellaceae bacterium]
MRREILATHAAFAAFGAFWGAWAAVLPAVKRDVGASKSELGLALLCVAVAALPSMLATGALVDRLGRGLVAPLLCLFAAAILAPGFATGVGTLALSLVGVGVTTGALDVAVNTKASALEAGSGRRLMPVAHALFSAGLVVASVSVGLARQAGAGRVGILFAVAAVLAATALLNARAAPVPKPESRPQRRLNLTRPLVALGLLCAAAFVVEGGTENWSALYLESRLGGDPAVGGLGPAAFAAAMVAGRLGGGAVERLLGERRILTIGSVLAAAGLLLAAAASSFALALVGFALTGIGISVAAPTLFGAAGRRAGEADRGTAVAAVTTVSYLGFLAGPPLIGAVAGGFGLRVAMAALA